MAVDESVFRKDHNTMGKAYRIASALALATLFASAAHAAEFKIFRSENDKEASLIVMRGEIELGDDAKLKELLVGLKTPPLIMLESPGGNLSASLGMGLAIRNAGANTIVDEKALCASGCALAWLGGKNRIAFPTSKIALHAASKGDGGEVTAAGNALIGVYMTRLGLGADAVLFATSAEPSSFNYLTFKTARSLGIEVTNMEELRSRLATREKAMGDDDPPARPAPAPPQRASSQPPPQTAPAPRKPTYEAVAEFMMESGYDLSEVNAANFDRAARAFWKRQGEAGTIGMRESITHCHQQAQKVRTPKAVSYCVSLDMMSVFLEMVAAKRLGTNPPAFHHGEEAGRRAGLLFQTVFPELNLQQQLALHERWTALAFKAFEDPANRTPARR